MGLKTYFGKHESTAVAILCILFFLMAASVANSSMHLSGTRYTAASVNYEIQGENLIITETFDTHVGGDYYNVLYRSFQEPLCLESLGETCNIRIQSVTCSVGTGYASKQEGHPLQPQTGDEIGVTHSNKIEANEIGCYSTNTIHQQQARLAVTYAVPLSHVQNNQNLHIFFAQDHFAINKLSVQGLSGSGTLNWIKQDKMVTINIDTGDITTQHANIAVLVLICLLFGSIPYLIWKRWGTEEQITVPEYLHVLPDEKMTPWQVDVLTNGTNNLSKNGMASILTELYVKDIVKIEEEKKFLNKDYVFLVKKDYDHSKVSEKANDLIIKLLTYREEGDKQRYRCKIPKTDTSFGLYMQNYYKGSDVKAFTKQTLNTTGYGFIVTMQVIAIALLYFGNSALFFSSDLGKALGLFLFTVLFTYLAVPKSVFSRFKEGKYKTYLEWLAFKKMLQDYAQLKKYLKEDYAMWKEWLVYGTALGAADNLLKGLKELQILSPEQYEATMHAHSNLIAFSLMSRTTMNSRTGGGMGGGFSGGIGGGGGFGGGGGGGR